MRIGARHLKTAAAITVLILVGAAGWLHSNPPELIRVGSGYAAKIVCSNVFLAGRDPEEVLNLDVQAPGNPLLKLLKVSVDREAGLVRAGLFGVFGDGLALRRDGRGCTALPDGDVDAVDEVPPPPSAPALSPSEPWPRGQRVEPAEDPGLAAILDDPQMTGPGMRAVVVVQDGRILAERYAPGFTPETPLLGWSMTKTVNAALLGTLVADGRMAVDQRELFPEWSDDGRDAITIADLMAMSDGLAFNEDYGDVTDVTRMLYLEPNMAGYAETRPLAATPGTRFSYSTGTAMLLARLWQDAVGDPAEALDWPEQALFGPLGMTSAVLELDESGTFVGGSYLYATARDWARFALMLAQDGTWNGRQVLPEDFVAWMRQPAPASGGTYGRGQLWLEGPDDPAGAGVAQGLPADTFWMLGHDGQSIAIIPSAGLVVVRMGLTPSRLGYRPQAMAAALVKALK